MRTSGEKSSDEQKKKRYQEKSKGFFFLDNGPNNKSHFVWDSRKKELNAEEVEKDVCCDREWLK